jgi:NAD(P) transhydrogenase subunit alpha
MSPVNLPSTMAPQASQLYSKNIITFLLAMLKDGALNLDTNDALVSGTMVTRDGILLHEAAKSALERS